MVGPASARKRIVWFVGPATLTVPAEGVALNPGTGPTENEDVPVGTSRNTICPAPCSVTFEKVTVQLLPAGSPVSQNSTAAEPVTITLNDPESQLET